jgi:hypothetical protein
MGHLVLSVLKIENLEIFEMTKEKQVTIELDARAAAAVRQVLFDAQKGYTYDEISVPPRVVDIRTVIQQLDDNIAVVLGV